MCVFVGSSAVIFFVSQGTHAILLETCRMELFPVYFQESNWNLPKFTLKSGVSLVCLRLAKGEGNQFECFSFTNGA